MCFNESWHFGVIFWLASVPVYSCPLQSIFEDCHIAETWTSIYKQRAWQPEQPPHWTMQNLEGHWHFNVESSTHVRKIQSLMQKHNSVIKQSYNLKKFALYSSSAQGSRKCICVARIKAIFTLTARQEISSKMNGHYQPHAIQVFPQKEWCTCLTLFDSNAAQLAALQSCAVGTFYYPHSIPKVQAEL